MLLNLSGAHAPYFTRNVVVVHDSAGNVGLGEVPGGEAVRATLVAAGELLVGQSLGGFAGALRQVGEAFGDRDAAGRGVQTFDQRVVVHAVTGLESALL